jgi:hypothetical protein
MNENCVSGIATKANEISCLAFQLWEKAGRPEGRDLEFWLGAEKHFLALRKAETVKVQTVVANPAIGKRVLATPLQARPPGGGGRSIL